MPPLDAEVAAEVARDPRHWWAEVITVFAALPVLILLGAVLRYDVGVSGGATSCILEAILAAVVIGIARRLARRSNATDVLGLHAPLRQDLPVALRWLLLQIGARFALTIVLVASIPSLSDPQHKPLTNTTGFTHLRGLDLVLALVAAAIIAPFAEELLFRGLVLRGLMRRWSFWPSAVASSLLFGALHGYEVKTAVAVVVLVSATALFGLLQSMLVRRTARLFPAMVVHGISNALVLTLVLARG